MRACPFCQCESPHTAVRQVEGSRETYHQVVCGVCGARGPKRQGHHEALTDWNVRKPPREGDLLQEFLEGLNAGVNGVGS